MGGRRREDGIRDTRQENDRIIYLSIMIDYKQTITHRQTDQKGFKVLQLGYRSSPSLKKGKSYNSSITQ